MKNLKQLIKRIISRLQEICQPIATSHSFLSALYYCFVSRSFGYEQQAILKAKLAYRKGGGLHGSSSALLRRNTHRLEKGLIMRPRRDVFALDYIQETVEVYVATFDQADFNQAERQWAHDVLSSYFLVVDNEQPAIANAYTHFKQAPEQAQLDCVPYKESARHPHNVTPEQFLALTKSRRSTRWFEPRKVERSLIIQAAEMALQAPSACNRQPYQFYVVDQNPLLKQLAALPGGTAGFAENIPCLVAVVGDQSYYPMERDRHIIYIDGSLASMQFMLGLETLGLASCPINWPELHKQDQRVSKLLSLPQYKRVVMFIAVGYALADGEIPYSDKKKAEDIIKYVGQ